MKTCSLLLVNDDPHVIAAVHEALIGVRHRLIVGPTSKAAISALNEHCSFDVLLVDLAGGLAGFALFDAVRVCCAQLRPIVLVGSDEWSLKEEAFLRGSPWLLEKPVRADELAAAVQESCGCGGRRPFHKRGLRGRLSGRPNRGTRQ